MLGKEMVRIMGGGDGQKYWGKRQLEIWEEEMVRNVGEKDD